jgi:hypothetical protein
MMLKASNLTASAAHQATTKKSVLQPAGLLAPHLVLWRDWLVINAAYSVEHPPANSSAAARQTSTSACLAGNT